MFYFQKMKSVLKCLSLSLTSFPPSPPSPSPLPTLPSQTGGYQLPRQEQTTVINFAVHFKRRTLSFLAVFPTLFVGATPGVPCLASPQDSDAGPAAHGGLSRGAACRRWDRDTMAAGAGSLLWGDSRHWWLRNWFKALLGLA